MTKQQIEEHKEVIKWWLDNPEKGVWKRTKFAYWELTHSPEFPVLSYYVQNDKYAEYRKALAEGKRLELCDTYLYDTANEKTWVTVDKIFDHIPASLYRIKMVAIKEPEFPCYFREKSSGTVVKFPEKSNRDCYSLNSELGVVVESSTTQAQKTLGFAWRCWDTFSNPDDWEQMHNYKEPSKFKAGDWVIYDNQPEYELILWNEKSERHYKNSDFKDCYTLWEPTQGEFCVFWDTEVTKYFVTQYRGKQAGRYVTKFNSSFKHIAPLEFIQTLKD